jgi:hypothetical protein
MFGREKLTEFCEGGERDEGNTAADDDNATRRDVTISNLYIKRERALLFYDTI